MTDELLVSLRSNVCWITLNRPERMNAFTGDILDRLASELERADDDRAVRAVVITGSGTRAFCAGSDVGTMAARRAEEEALARPDSAEFEEVVERARLRMQVVVRLHELSKPTIASINGVAAGGGVPLALACDYRIASSTADLVLAFPRMALPGDLGISYFLSGIVGPARARELCIFRPRLDAAEAQALGLWSEVVPPAELAARTLELVGTAAAGPTLAYAATKRALSVASGGNRLQDALAYEARATKQLSRTEDAREAVAAFSERREPVFEGR